MRCQRVTGGHMPQGSVGKHARHMQWSPRGRCALIARTLFLLLGFLPGVVLAQPADPVNGPPELADGEPDVPTVKPPLAPPTPPPPSRGEVVSQGDGNAVA